MNTLKPFHESIIDAISAQIEQACALRPPDIPKWKEKKKNIIEKLIEDLSILLNLIKNTSIPADKINTTIISLEALSDTEAINTLEKEKYNLTELIVLFDEVRRNLEDRR